jgi:hypothetical protein
MTLSITSFSTMALSIKGLFLTLSIAMLCHFAECRYAECQALVIVILNEAYYTLTIGSEQAYIGLVAFNTIINVSW